ncbi:1-acylglycerol-3-phosphate acyltransferase, putative [Pediculus humanus corporis]|uniref:1-acylglycerol-3-phosphate acyltransferase, putative n=1 Tax=Pediculus humanus subsp. corporis TaxID=121224 RepID=E0VPT9_PEDHC|nr:1-acylglycerol-3-phosphate acyltransferase, putative [Pediculus humanus corporis]EEB15395.1 1-acylglycerol-3-phosphate acyltransferase, putative [Pediculus humanus corporis]
MVKKIKINMKDRIIGLLFVIIWYVSVLAGFFTLICPILPLAIISPKKYRKLSDKVFGMWEPFTAAMLEIFFGTRIYLTGDKINPYESSVLIMNHRTRVDWGFLWLALFHCCQPNAHNVKYVLKSSLMHLPGPGWVMQTCSFIFVHRNWSRDKFLINQMINYLNNSDQLYQVLIFPEGTDLTEDTIRKSHKYADEKNYERYYKVLHPKTSGFAFIVQKMKTGGQLKAIYDITIGYPKTIPISERDLIKGKFPEEVHLHVKRYSSRILPHQEKDLKKWLRSIWKGKEMLLQNFYTVKHFPTEKLKEDSYENINFQIKINGETSHEKSSHEFELNSLQYTSSNEKSIINENADADDDDDDDEDEDNNKMKNSHNWNNPYKTPNYRPSHLLSIVLGFWMILTNGFHQMVASIYFTRYKKKPQVIKKLE